MDSDARAWRSMALVGLVAMALTGPWLYIHGTIPWDSRTWGGSPTLATMIWIGGASWTLMSAILLIPTLARRRRRERTH